MTHQVIYKNGVPRVRPADRFDQLIRAAATTFINSGGFHRTQIVDIAAALGVAKGTVYLLAESKEALFDAVLAHADSPTPIAAPPLPISSPDRNRATQTLRERLHRESQFPVLTSATASEAPADVGAELASIISELFTVLARNRVTIKLLTVTAADLPELANEWFENGRGQLVARLASYLRKREAQGALAPCPTPEISARLILETTSWFAVHRHYDPLPQSMTDDDARAEVVRVLSRSFAPALG